MRTAAVLLIGATLGLSSPAWASPGGAAGAPGIARAGGESRFPMPPVLEARVRFWIRIYSEVTTDGGLIHDARDLSVVYEVLSFEPGTTQRTRERTRERAKKRIVEALKALGKGKRSGLSGLEKRVLAAWGPDVTNAKLRAATRYVRFQLGQADKFQAGIVRSGAWLGYIQQVLRDRGLPAELAVLPHVESSFNPLSMSHAGASGIWQFTRGTGRIFMRVDHVMDERRDPWASSVAAARLLEANYRKLGTWPLAITAYNHGSAGMARAKRQLGTSDIGVITEKYSSRSFKFASRNFYSEFLAALHVVGHAEKYFGPLDLEPAANLAFVKLEHYYRADDLARAVGLDRKQLRVFNLALLEPVWNGQKYVPKDYEIRVPRHATSADPYGAIAAIPTAQRFAKQTPDRFYKVKRGDTLSRIARRHGVRESEIVALNGLRSRHRIRIGQRLKLPVPGGSTASTPVSVARLPRPEDGRYRVKRGDNLSVIAQRFGVSVSELAAANELRNRNALKPGQVLVVPGAEATKTAAPVEVAKTPEPEPAPPVEVAKAPEPEPAPPVEVAEAPEPEPAPPVEVTKAPAPPGALPLDPSRFAVDAENRIEVQPDETLGHYADWLQVSASSLRRLNGLAGKSPVHVGGRLQLDLSRSSPADFERARLAHHRALQKRFFDTHRIAGTEQYVLRRGDTLWRLAQKNPSVPMWLIRDYNPSLDFSSLRPGASVTVPRVERRG